MNNYETTFIIDAELESAQVEQKIQKFEDFLKSNKAEIIRQENWGTKRLAYRVKKKGQGVYAYVLYKAEGTLISDLDTQLRLDPDVLRHLTVTLDKKKMEYTLRNPRRTSSRGVSTQEETKEEKRESAEAVPAGEPADQDIQQESEEETDADSKTEEESQEEGR